MRWIVAMLIASPLLAQSAAEHIQSLEQQADAEFSKHDWAEAEKSYLDAVQAAQAAGEPARIGLYYRRIGMSRGRVGKIAESLGAYRRGDARAARLNVSRQAVIKTLLRQALDGAPRAAPRRRAG